MVLLTCFIFKEPEDKSIDQVYLSDILDTDEYIPTLDEVIEELGQSPSYEEVRSTYDQGVAELHSNKLLPFESELMTIEDSNDLQAIKRVYFEDVVTGISLNAPEYYLDENQMFTVNHQNYHIIPQPDALFTADPSFTNLSEGIDAGFFQAFYQNEDLTKVEGLIRVTEDKTAAEVMEEINNLDASLGGEPVQILVEIVDEEILLGEPTEFFEHEELYQYQDGGGNEIIIDSYDEYQYLRPHLYPYVQSSYSNDELQLIEGTVIEWQGFVDDAANLEEEQELVIGENSWSLQPYDDETAIEVE